ncbi:MAG: class I SAM-dependent methyltransferase [Saprospiraceae bacterium]|nr:class I SAM-dependent methyltransferase [Saprospiraceae bacterium]
MLSNIQKSNLRSGIFHHLDGLVTVPTAYTLYSKGVIEYLLNEIKVDISELSIKFSANEGYMNVAMHVLACQGWLVQNVNDDGKTTTYEVTSTGKEAFSNVHLYREANELLKLTEKFHPRLFEIEPFKVWEKAKNNFVNGYDIQPDADNKVLQNMLRHIEGVLIAPSIVHLAMNGMFHKYFMEASFKPEEYHRHPECFEVLLDFFTHLGWFEKMNGTYKFTETGVFYARRASAYGVTVSYIPTLRHLEDLIFGDPDILRQTVAGAKELHVDRSMNVWGSGGAHTAYFEEVDKILIEIFNQDIELQPKGLLDMGCGNGAFLIHAFDVIERQTKRGKMLEDYPLVLVGADYNEEALKVSRANIIQADVWAKFVQADISRPDLLAQMLHNDYNVNLRDLLNFRSFIDHNRVWQFPVERKDFSINISSGAYAYRGQKINNRDAESSLYEHLQLWQPYISKHGLLVIELHTIDPSLTATHLGKTAATAYDATHGYSDQYILEIDMFHAVASACGLKSDERFQKRFPDSEIATVSIQLFRG